MFETQFYNLGKAVSANKKKIIVAWIIIFFVMAPFSLSFFNNVNYNFGSNMIPKNSQSYQSNKIIQQQFSAGAQSDPAQLVIVITGVDLNNSQYASEMFNLQNSIGRYYSSSGYGFSGFQSIFTVEKTLLENYSSKLKPLENATSSLLNSSYHGVYQFIPVANGTADMEFGLPSVYLQNFTENYSKSGSVKIRESYAYNQTILAAGNSSVALSYVKNFTKVWNASAPLPSPVAVMNTAINDTVNSSWTSNAIPVNQSILRFLFPSLAANETLAEFQAKGFQVPFIVNYSMSYIASGLSSNATVESLLKTGLNTTAYSLVSRAYDMAPFGASAQEFAIKLNSTTASMVAYGVKSTLNGNPLIKYNPGYLTPYLSLLYGTTNITALVNSEFEQKGINQYPLLPRSYVVHQFVGYSYNSMIVLALFSSDFKYSLVTHTEGMLAQPLSNISGSNYYLAGNSAFSSQLNNEVVSGLIIALIAGISLSIVIVGLFFRSPISAIMPFIFFIMASVIGMGINGLLYTYVFNSSASFITPTLMLILLLGLTSDYVVYIMARFRRELVKRNPDAIAETAKWAGHAVFTSGITVALSYLILWIFNVPLFSDAGITNAIGISVSIALATTMLTAVMATLGHRMFWPSHPEKHTKATFEDGMNRLAKSVVHNRKKIFAAMIIITLAGTYLYSITPTNMDIYQLLPQSSGVQAIVAVNSTFHGDYFDRGFVVLQMASPIMTNNSGNITYNMTELSQITAVEQKIASDRNFSQVYGPTFPFGYFVNVSSIPAAQKAVYEEKINGYLGNNTSYAVIYFQNSALAYLPQTSVQVANLQPMIRSVDPNNSFNFYVGGLTQGFSDVYAASVSAFVGMIPILAISIFVILFFQLGSVLTPARLILMVMAAVAVSLSVTFIAFYYILAMPIVVFLPMFVFVTLLAVGLDYDIFMITRVREEISKGSTTEDAIIKSISESGGVIITLGAILFVTFSALAFGGIPILQEIGIGLALGVLFDTFISWPFFVPVVMLYLKRYNWWPSKLSGK